MTDHTQKAGPTPGTGHPQHTHTDTEHTRDPRQILAAASGHCVLVESAHGKYRRRLYLSLSAAEKAVQRARDNGKYAALVLAVVSPVEVVL